DLPATGIVALWRSSRSVARIDWSRLSRSGTGIATEGLVRCPSFAGFPRYAHECGARTERRLINSPVGGRHPSTDRRPRLAGVLLGAMCFKPQLAILVVPALIAARRWQTLLWAAVVVAGLSFASLLIFGEGAWRGFLAIGPLATAVLEFGGVGFAKMVST